MTHHISGVVGATVDLLPMLEKYAFLHVPLEGIFGLVPANDFFKDAAKQVYPSSDVCTHGFRNLDVPVVAMLKELSQTVPIGFVETDYFGGSGFQAGAFFARGQCIFAITDELLDVEPCGREGPINWVLRLLGVRLSGLDEFEAVGLGKYRTMNALEAAASDSWKNLIRT